MQIPTFGESQVLQPGNPVEIGRADTAMADSMAYLGKAMVNLGNEMDKEEKAKKNRIGEYQVQAALEDFELQKRIFNQRLIKDQESRKDITGIDALKESNKYGDDLANEMASQYGFTPLQMAQFTAGTKKIRNNLDPELMVASAKATEEDYNSAVTNTLNITTGKVFQNPALTDQYMAQVVHDTMDDYDKGLVLNLDKALADRQGQVIMGAINKFKVANRFDDARQMIIQHATMFSNKDRETYLDEIRTAETAYINNENTKAIQQQREEEKFLAKNQSDNSVLLYAELEQAGGMGSFAVARVKQKATSMMLTGAISPEMGKAIAAYEPSLNKELSDPALTGKILAKAFTTNNFNGAMKELNKAWNAKTITASAYLDTVKEIGRYQTYQNNKNSDKSWDTAKMTLNVVLDQYKAMGKDPGSLDSVQTAKMSQVLMTALNEVDKMQRSGKGVDFTAIQDTVAKTYGSMYSAPAPTVSNGVQIKGLDGIEKEIKDRLLRVKDKSIPTSERQKEMYNIKQLEKRRQLLLKEGAGRGTNDQSGNTGTRSSNATKRTN